MKKAAIPILVLLILLTLQSVSGCGGEKTKETSTNKKETTTEPSQPIPPPTPVSQSSFETVGMFDNSPIHVAISYYVTNPTQADITSQCNEMKARFIDSGITASLQISFFDDRANTPDYSGGVDIPESSQLHEVANYFYNANNSQTRLIFLKPIP